MLKHPAANLTYRAEGCSKIHASCMETLVAVRGAMQIFVRMYVLTNICDVSLESIIQLLIVNFVCL